MECIALEQPTAIQLYREHGPAIRTYVASRVRDDAVAEDLCHETFVAALDKGVPENGAGRWLFAIARNKVRSHIRDRKPAAGIADRPALTAGPLEALSREERALSVRQAVEALDDDLREAILLRYEGGLDYASIADRLDVPLSTIQGRLKRARWALKKALKEEGQ
jgi:RNA polymerase sigma-70 factor (ECF subfamily)